MDVEKTIELSESQKTTGERLNILIRIVQDHIDRHPPAFRCGPARMTR